MDSEKDTKSEVDEVNLTIERVPSEKNIKKKKKWKERKAKNPVRAFIHNN
jgi:hypothetical protein